MNNIDWKIEGKYEDYKYLVERLQKECSTGRKGYEGIGVEIDAPKEDFKSDFVNGRLENGDTIPSRLFGMILFEIDNMMQSGYEYTYEYNQEDDAWLTNGRQVVTYVNRLKRFCKKYSMKFLDEKLNEDLIKEINKL